MKVTKYFINLENEAYEETLESYGGFFCGYDSYENAEKNLCGADTIIKITIEEI